MARIPYFDPEKASDRVLKSLAGKRKINVFRMIANSENCAPEVFALGQTVSKGSSLDPVHREVVILRVAHLSGANYQWHEHTVVAQRVGLSPKKIDSVASYPEKGAEEFDPFEELLLRFTDAVVETTTTPDEVFDAIHARYGDSKMVELVLIIGFYMMVGRIMNTFELELETHPVESYRLRLE
ncbi:4-carboxymuconolactone decarboxylase [Rhodococcus rhodochrous]|uniref:carboxymuconolactone decarboxylase family protein n=1 Tax=Rhodococcus rhodochrous TaxID=1829 RepID=UPI000750F554|nr:carboxymuconolactone decarboxylase family protein [Rhodococcus rhodochrous]MDO1484622.1 carboxymuconolactone decarboxylase family protein [Rhodococcus rhodochrous]SNV27255.1 4-carboxymuconolactone decarboxylase [Rhodococcus rhodochrous]